MTTTKVLFDESHNELLRSQKIPDDDEVDTWNQLGTTLNQELGCDVTLHTVNETGEEHLTQELLSGYKVLVLAAPRKPLTNAEVEAIVNFVHEGNSLLIAQSYQSLNEFNTCAINLLLEKFGLRTKPLLTNPPSEIPAKQFRSHYLSSEVNRLLVKEPAYLETINDLPRVVATLPRTEENFLATVEVKRGRVVVIGDFVIFGDEYFEEADNKKLVLNIFQWLICKNSLECFDAQFKAKVTYGKTSTFSISLSNPHRKRLEHISCLLESDAGAAISEPEQRIRSLPARGRTQLQWTVEPQKLGFQSLRLTIDFPEKTGYPSLFFDSVAEFQCVPDVEIDLINLTPLQKAPEIVETGVPFEMQAIVRWANGAKQVPLQLNLKSSPAHVTVESVGQSETNHWRLIALDAGDWKIHLEVAELDQPITRLIRAYPSTQKRIHEIERDIVILLTAEVHHQVSQLRGELVSPVIQKIPFRLLTPEDQVRLLEPPDTREALLEALRAARKEEDTNQPLVQYLLENIAPTYSPVHGCCIPYDPKLADHLVAIRKHAPFEEHLAYNLMGIDGDERYGQTWLKQNIVALLLHEKYGHGFFFSQTKLGKQLAILYKYGLEPATDSKHLRAPYPRSLYNDYESVIDLIYDSSIIVNEGFATWLELVILPRLSELMGQAAYRRRDFLFHRDSSMVDLAQDSEYFQKFQPQRVSKYREGCEYLELIHGYFGSDWGPKCAVQAMIKATDVDLGITESGGQVQFGLQVEQLKAILLNEQSKDAQSDERLRAIHDVLRKHIDEIIEQQEELQCHRSCLHSNCPINSIIADKLGW
ncbi:hypothetical protein BZZ01_25325 [Nostocales cyanobacterium HT-58-2]|nr:hypothetical protein BZZ01_25325 [Nostocales cyanobacterium HT-58-2]